MFISTRILDFLKIAQSTYDDLRTENAALKSKVTELERSLAYTQVNLDWLRINYNVVSQERTALLKKAYAIDLPSPQLAREVKAERDFNPLESLSFEDMGNELARQFGYPVYEEKAPQLDS